MNYNKLNDYQKAKKTFKKTLFFFLDNILTLIASFRPLFGINQHKIYYMRYERKHLKTEEALNIISLLYKKPGVYRIYLNNKIIERLVGCDNDGLLYIGSAQSSNGLMKRIRDFFDSATNCTTAHSAGRFYHLYMESLLGKAIEVLVFEYELTADDKSALALESTQLRTYLTKYGELPPLNNQIPT